MNKFFSKTSLINRAKTYEDGIRSLASDLDLSSSAVGSWEINPLLNQRYIYEMIEDKIKELRSLLDTLGTLEAIEMQGLEDN